MNNGRRRRSNGKKGKTDFLLTRVLILCKKFQVLVWYAVAISLFILVCFLHLTNVWNLSDKVFDKIETLAHRNERTIFDGRSQIFVDRIPDLH